MPQGLAIAATTAAAFTGRMASRAVCKTMTITIMTTMPTHGPGIVRAN